MATTARDKARLREWAWHVSTLDDRPSLTPAGHFDAGFNAGWDARGQVTPDREALVELLFKTAYDGDGGWMPYDQFKSMCGGVADAILALFNEKGMP